MLIVIPRAATAGLRRTIVHSNALSLFPRVSLVRQHSFLSTTTTTTTTIGMKVRSSTVSALAVLSSCFLPHPSGAWAPQIQQQPQRRFLSFVKTHTHDAAAVSLKAAIMADEEADVAITPPETSKTEATIMAKGHVVSFFRGGLAAVKIDEDQLLEEAVNTASSSNNNVVSPTDVPTVKKFNSDAGGDFTGHRVVFPNGQKGVVVAHRPPISFVYSGVETLDDQDGTVSILKEMANISVGDDKKVVRWDGTPIAAATGDDVNDESNVKERAIFAPIPQVKDIALINNPMLTGNTMVDVLAPIGQGQNMLLVADDLAAARGMVCDFISTQQRRSQTVDGGEGKKGTKFVYAAIDDSDDVVEKLQAAGVADSVHVVLTSSSSSSSSTTVDDDGSNVEEAAKAAEATAMAASACAIAESYALEQGMNTVVVIDTLDQHKKLWDATTRVLVDVFGVDSVVKSDRDGGASSEMRGFFSSVVQRSAQYKANRGGGSVTLLLLMQLPTLTGGADEDTIYSESDFEGSSEKVRGRIQLLVNKKIPLTAATLRKIEIPVPSASEGKRRLVLQHVDDLISMSDGQIWLDEKLREAGQYPPIDPQRSITRIGIGADTKSRADAPALRRIAEGLRLDLSQAANMEGAEDSVASKKQARRRNALLLAMHQKEGTGGRALSESCTALLAASNGLLDDAVASGNLAGTEAGQKIMDGMLDHVRQNAPDAMVAIDQSLDLSEESKKEVLDAIGSFFSS